jgi:hypothetical protein
VLSSRLLPWSKRSFAKLNSYLTVAAMSGLRARREKVALSSGPTRRPLEPGATGAVMEATRWLKRSV